MNLAKATLCLSGKEGPNSWSLGVLDAVRSVGVPYCSCCVLFCQSNLAAVEPIAAGPVSRRPLSIYLAGPFSHFHNQDSPRRKKRPFPENPSHHCRIKFTSASNEYIPVPPPTCKHYIQDTRDFSPFLFFKSFVLSYTLRVFCAVMMCIPPLLGVFLRP